MTRKICPVSHQVNFGNESNHNHTPLYHEREALQQKVSSGFPASPTTVQSSNSNKYRMQSSNVQLIQLQVTCATENGHLPSFCQLYSSPYWYKNRGLSRRGFKWVGTSHIGRVPLWKHLFFSRQTTVADLRLLPFSIANVRLLVNSHCYDCAVYIKAHRIHRSKIISSRNCSKIIQFRVLSSEFMLVSPLLPPTVKLATPQKNSPSTSHRCLHLALQSARVRLVCAE